VRRLARLRVNRALMFVRYPTRGAVAAGKWTCGYF
jgi:hypothetical protein